MRARILTIAACCVALALGACQSSQPTAAAVDGTWASLDATPQFQTTFANGAFTTRLAGNNEPVANGKYTVGAEGVSLSWVSLATNEPRSGLCAFAVDRTLRCTPSAGNPFTMARVVA